MAKNMSDASIEEINKQRIEAIFGRELEKNRFGFLVYDTDCDARRIFDELSGQLVSFTEEN